METSGRGERAWSKLIYSLWLGRLSCSDFVLGKTDFLINADGPAARLLHRIALIPLLCSEELPNICLDGRGVLLMEAICSACQYDHVTVQMKEKLYRYSQRLQYQVAQASKEISSPGCFYLDGPIPCDCLRKLSSKEIRDHKQKVPIMSQHREEVDQPL